MHNFFGQVRPQISLAGQEKKFVRVILDQKAVPAPLGVHNFLGQVRTQLSLAGQEKEGVRVVLDQRAVSGPSGCAQLSWSG